MMLGAYLREKKLSAAAFARQVGRSRSAVGRWVSGSRFPEPASLRAIIRATGGAVTADDFLSDDAAPRAT